MKRGLVARLAKTKNADRNKSDRHATKTWPTRWRVMETANAIK